MTGRGGATATATPRFPQRQNPRNSTQNTPPPKDKQIYDSPPIYPVFWGVWKQQRHGGGRAGFAKEKKRFLIYTEILNVHNSFKKLVIHNKYSTKLFYSTIFGWESGGGRRFGGFQPNFALFPHPKIIGIPNHVDSNGRERARS